MTALETMRYNNNVVGYTNNSFGESFQQYMRDVKKNSIYTYRTYLGCYKEFFLFVLGKDITENIAGITWNDVVNITYNDVLNYRYYLVGIKKPANSNQTANQKIVSLNALWGELKKHNEQINTNVTALKPLKAPEANGSEALTESEAWNLLGFASKRDYKPFMQKMFFKIAIITALRKTALFELTWDQIKKHKDRETGMEYWCIDVVDKNQHVIKPLRDDIYEELLELKDKKYNAGMKREDNRVFKISEDKIVGTLKAFCKEYNVSRRITLHSLRKTSSDIANIIAKGNIKRIQQQTGHKNAEILVKTYQGTRDSLSTFPGLSMFSNDVDIKKLQQYSKDEIISAINKCDKSILRSILNNLEK